MKSLLVLSALALSTVGYGKNPQAAGILIKLKDSSSFSVGPNTTPATALRIRQEHVLDFVEAKANNVKFKLFNSHTRILHRGHTALKWDIVDVESNDYESLAELVRDMSADPEIEYVDLNVIHYPTQAADPNDSRFTEQWDLFSPTAGIQVKELWPITQGENSVVAVIDTGIINHGDLAANILPGYDFISDSARAVDGNGRDNDPTDAGDWKPAQTCPDGAGGFLPAENSSWHGTHVAGTIAAIKDNSFGIAGVAPSARILPVRVLGRCGGTTADIVDAMVWSAGLPVPGVPNNPNPAQILNLSLGGGGTCGTAYAAAIARIRGVGASVVVAAGNSGEDLSVSPHQPATCADAITVAASTKSGGKAGYSNFGSIVDIAAPGSNILSTLDGGTTTPLNDNSFRFYNGTSMATPHVSGALALLRRAFLNQPVQVYDTILRESVRPLPAGNCSQCGTGLLDLSLAKLDQQCSKYHLAASPYCIFRIKTMFDDRLGRIPTAAEYEQYVAYLKNAGTLAQIDETLQKSPEYLAKIATLIAITTILLQ